MRFNGETRMTGRSKMKVVLMETGGRTQRVGRS